MIQYIKTNMAFDTAKMKAEAAQLSSINWKAHYNKKDYEGDWSVLPLRSINGNIENAVSVHASAAVSAYANTSLLDNCPYLQMVIDAFQCEKTSVRLMKLNAGAIIKEHTDHDMNMEAGEARFHIPVQTNEDVAFFIMEDRIPMMEGECWYLNLSLPHKVHNAGNNDRIHLVIDVMVNDWVKHLLDHEGSVRKDIEGIPKKSFNIEEQQRIINELKQQNTPAALQLAAQLEASL